MRAASSSPRRMPRTAFPALAVYPTPSCAPRTAAGQRVCINQTSIRRCYARYGRQARKATRLRLRLWRFSASSAAARVSAASLATRSSRLLSSALRAPHHCQYITNRCRKRRNSDQCSRNMSRPVAPAAKSQNRKITCCPSPRSAAPHEQLHRQRSRVRHRCRHPRSQ